MRRNKQKHDFFRLYLIEGLFFVLCGLFITRLFSIQVLGHSQYKAMADEQYWNLQDIPAKRGDIYSKDGFVLATTQDHYLLYIQPKNVENKDILITTLTEYFSKTAEDDEKRSELQSTLRERLNVILSSDLYWAAFEHNITPPQKAELEAMNLKGIGFEDEPVRFYPEGSLAAHILGFVASNEKGDKQGYYGIEGFFDGDLKGKPGRIIQEKDATGTPILIGGYKRVDPIDGRDIILTIDRSVQYIVEKLLKEGVEKYDAVSGSVIVMEPFSGDIIAMANYPTYNPAKFADEAEESTKSKHRKTIERTNLAISETYEPGSVIKPLTVSASFDLEKANPNTTFEDKGPVRYSDYIIDNWDGKHYGTQTITELLQKSNNIGAAWVGHLVGSKEMHRYFSSFGIGSRLGIDLEGEDSGILRDYKTWTDIDLANIAFGQGMSATPLQVVSAFSTIANGGNLMQPKIVYSISEDGKTIPLPSRKVREVIKPKTSETMTEVLTDAAAGGESKYFNLKNYKIAGKTGTAQIPKGGGYDPSKTNATFVGYLPTSKKFVMIVRLDRPSTSTYAAETAVPLWMQITDELVKYYGIVPDTQL